MMVATVALLAIGYWAGTASSFFRHMWAGSAVTESVTKAAILSLRVSQITDGKTGELKNDLNVELDAEILLLDALIDWDSQSENDATAIKILRRIAKQRHSGSYSNANTEVQRRLLGICEKAAAYSLKDKTKPQPAGAD